MFKPSEEIRVKAKFTLSTNPKHKKVKTWIACNGEALVSKQELEIYEYLLEQESLHVCYEQAFEGKDRIAYPDFTITNLKTGKVYIWEHFGMTNSEQYLNNIPKKLEWFREQGVLSIEQGGNLIITFYRKSTFYKDVANFVELINSDKG